ncbi:hypothetical protein M3638_01270 [Oceanobacillus profundus]|uniref:hypothetical protein n=1 Tax=Oceanobacillus profundus TaxID=372463 RepID=UPI002040847F|nr:hypothetical protein [Oceanobacillus profundus]MCM3396464.1 hypothetical protein [Oceanobacillus profundus]
MIKEALQYIVGMGKAEIHKENGQSYSDKKLHLIEEPTAGPFIVHTLSGLVDYVSSGVDKSDKMIVHVVSPTEVRVESPLNRDRVRDYYVNAEALIPEFRFDRWYDTEDFNIKLQSCFVKSEDRDIMLKVVGNITEDQVKTVSDDGVSQAVVAKVGVASVGNVEVPNPVSLAPYRTFVEVEQPQSDFIFRMQSGPRCALFEADGGAWKNEAIDNIKKYLEAALVKEISSKHITIIA